MGNGPILDNWTWRRGQREYRLLTGLDSGRFGLLQQKYSWTNKTLLVNQTTVYIFSQN